MAAGASQEGRLKGLAGGFFGLGTAAVLALNLWLVPQLASAELADGAGPDSLVAATAHAKRSASAARDAAEQSAKPEIDLAKGSEPRQTADPNPRPPAEAAPEPATEVDLIAKTAPEPEPEPAAITKGAPEPVAKAEPEPVAKAEPEPVVKTEPEPVVKTEPEPVVKTEPKPEPEPVTKAEPKPEPEPVAKAEPEPEPVAKAEPKPEPEPVVKAEPKPEPEPVAKAEPKPEPEPVAKAEPKPEPEPVVKAEPKPEPEPVAKAEPEPMRPSGGDLRTPPPTGAFDLKLYFTVSTTTLSEAQGARLSAFARRLRRRGRCRIRVDCYTDRIGGDELNINLSVRRCRAVKAELLRHHVIPSGVSYEAHGERLTPGADGVPDGRNRIAGLRATCDTP